MLRVELLLRGRDRLRLPLQAGHAVDIDDIGESKKDPLTIYGGGHRIGSSLGLPTPALKLSLACG